jgi:uncharacterized protein (TIGR00266 family)
MEYSIQHRPVFSVLELRMNEAERVVAQPNSMLSMTPGIVLSAAVGRRGEGSSWWSGTKSLLGGESFFTAEFTAKRDGQALVLAPSNQGDILEINLGESNGFYLTGGSYLANIGNCKLKTKYGGMKGVMSKKGLFLLHVSGEGTVFCQSYGAIIRRDLGEDEKFFLDNRYAIAFSDTIQYQLVKATESMKDSLMSGEGLVNRYTGPGTLYYQTRAKPSMNLFGYFWNSPF